MDRQLFKIHNYKDLGEVHIADEVVAIISAMAALEVDGVKGMIGTTTDDIVELLGKKNLSKGVKVEAAGTDVKLSLALVIDYGANIVELTEKVTDKVVNAVETMTGLNVLEVNINIEEVSINKQ